MNELAIRSDVRHDQLAGSYRLGSRIWDLARSRHELEDLRTLEIATVRQLDTTGDDGESLLDVAIDPGEGAVAQLERKELRQHLANAISALPERERQILALSYEEELTLAEIGQVLGVSESRVCQLRSQAISRLRSTLRETLLSGARQ